jgi:hypothetical protein
MLGMRHPFTRALYEQDGAGHIKVTRTDGAWGIFNVDGSWVRGAVEECDAQMCNWISGPQFRNMRVSADQN